MDGFTHAAIAVYIVITVGLAFGIWCIKTQKAEKEASQKTTNED
jgi:ABC-type proline/glycine betaine transport system permease subunit